jgi:alpha-1,2-glucosyltransferase
MKGSTLFVLLAYLFHLKDRHRLSALFCFISIMFRQTNIVWVVFFTAQLILKQFDNFNKAQKRNESNIVKIMLQPSAKVFDDKFDCLTNLKQIYKEDLFGRKLIFSNLMTIFRMRNIRSYLFIIILFITFVRLNGGIVVGDKQNHTASFHLMQIFYFLTFTAIFTSSFILSSSHLTLFQKIKNYFSFLIRYNVLNFIILLPLLLLIIKNFTLVHQFMLADNRHYIFYIWSKFLGKNEMFRYFLAPLYLTCGYFFVQNINHKSFGWLFIYLICSTVCLVPQKLIEFRYFIIPFFIYRLNLTNAHLKQCFIEILINISINFITIYIFLNKTFHWPDDDALQRFMW